MQRCANVIYDVVLCLSIRLSVCLSHVGVVYQNIGSCNQCQTIVQALYFLRQRSQRNSSGANPNGNAKHS